MRPAVWLFVCAAPTTVLAARELINFAIFKAKLISSTRRVQGLLLSVSTTAAAVGTVLCPPPLRRLHLLQYNAIVTLETFYGGILILSKEPLTFSRLAAAGLSGVWGGSSLLVLVSSPASPLIGQILAQPRL